MNNENDESNLQTFTDDSFVVKNISKEFYDRYGRSNRARKRFYSLIRPIKVDVSFDVNESENEYLLKISGPKSEIDKATMLVKQASQQLRNRFTHLITIPFLHDDFIKAYLDFKEKILNENSDIDECLFQNPKKLHMTISCLSLEDDKRLTDAREIFRKQCSDYIEKFNNVNNFERRLQIKAIDIMNDNPRRTNVLYAKIENDNLQNLANHIANVMASNEFLYSGDKFANESDQQQQQVKLHLTLMNSSYLRRGFNKKRRKPMMRYFDSTEILNNYGDYFFSEIDWPPIQLNELHRTNQFGYYNVLESIQI